MKRRGFTYISAIFSAAIFMTSCGILLKTASLAQDAERIARIKKLLAAENLSVIEEIKERMQNGEQIELNDYSKENTKVRITADENSTTFLVTAKSGGNGANITNRAVLFR